MVYTSSLHSLILSLISALQEWYPHFFVLTSSKIYYSEETSSNQGNDDEEEHREVSRSHLLLKQNESTDPILNF